MNKQTVANFLREAGWYGNKHLPSAEDAADPGILVMPTDYGKLAKHAIKMANKRFIGMCTGGLSRTIINLKFNQSLVEVEDPRIFYTNLVVFSLTHEAVIIYDKDGGSNGDDSKDEEGAGAQESK